MWPRSLQPSITASLSFFSVTDRMFEFVLKAADGRVVCGSEVCGTKTTHIDLYMSKDFELFQSWVPRWRSVHAILIVYFMWELVEGRSVFGGRTISMNLFRLCYARLECSFFRVWYLALHLAASVTSVLLTWPSLLSWNLSCFLHRFIRIVDSCELFRFEKIEL